MYECSPLTQRNSATATRARSHPGTNLHAFRIVHCRYTETPLVGGLLENKELVSNIIARTPMKRIAQPVEIARVAAFAASPAAGYLTGQTIRVDGGYSAMGLYF